MRVTGVATCRLRHRRHVLAGVGVCVRVSGKMCAIWSRPSAHLLEKMSVSGTGLRRRLDLVEGSAEECHCEVVQNSSIFAPLISCMLCYFVCFANLYVVIDADTVYLCTATLLGWRKLALGGGDRVGLSSDEL
jgi:hypothetical protein